MDASCRSVVVRVQRSRLGRRIKTTHAFRAKSPGRGDRRVRADGQSMDGEGAGIHMISSLRTLGLRALVVVFLVCGLVAPRASVGAETALRIDSEGDYIGFGLVRDFTEADGTFTFELQEPGRIIAHWASHLDPHDYFSFLFQAPDGQVLAPGNYELADRFIDEAPLLPKIDASTFGKSCNISYGRFVILELERDPVTGLISSFAAEMEHWCDIDTTPLRASLRYQSSVPLHLPRPVAAAGMDRIAVERELVPLDGRGSLPGFQETITQWQWRQIEGTPVELTGAETSMARFIAPAVAAPGETLRFELRTVNSAGLESTDIVDAYVQHKLSPRSIAYLVGGGGFDNLRPNEKLTLLEQYGLFDAQDLPTANVANLRWRGYVYDWLFQIQETSRLAPHRVTFDTDKNPWPFFTILTNATWCAPRPHGWYEILEITFTGDHIDSIAVNFELYCGAFTVPHRGKLRWNVAMPDANAGPDLVAEGRATVALSAAASRPAVGAIRDYRWQQLSGPAVTISASGDGARFTAPDVAVETTLKFELTVTDERGIDDMDVVEVRITPATPLPPPPPPPTSGGGGKDNAGGGGAAGWLTIAMLGMCAALRRRRRLH